MLRFSFENKNCWYLWNFFWHGCLLLGWRSYFLKENIYTRRKTQKRQMNWVPRSKIQIWLLREFDSKKWNSGAWIKSWSCWLGFRRFSIIDYLWTWHFSYCFHSCCWYILTAWRIYQESLWYKNLHLIAWLWYIGSYWLFHIMCHV